MSTTDHDLVDITIIGAGPTGLFGLFYAGMRGASARIVDALPELGGQLRALYPEKYVYDVAGFPKILAKDLANRLEEQALQFDPEVRLEERAERLERVEPEPRADRVGRDPGDDRPGRDPGEDRPGPDPDAEARSAGHWILETDQGRYPTRTVVIAAGKGAFEPRRLDVPGFERFWKNGVWPHVHDPEAFRGRRVLLVGGGDSAFDWSRDLADVVESLTHVHRSDRFRAHESTVATVREAARQERLELLTFHEVDAIHGNGRVEAATIFDNRTDERRRLEVDAVLSLIGFKPDPGPLEEWGLEVDGRTIRVDGRMRTNLPGVFAAGDVAHHEGGTLELLATGFGEAAVAVNQAVHHADPDARVTPGHSTSLAVFKDR